LFLLVLTFSIDNQELFVNNSTLIGILIAACGNGIGYSCRKAELDGAAK